jgi:argonaute-like protein implicated in RNA metabolism and viral defense
VVITPADLQGQAELFTKQLRDGIASSTGFQKGFVRKYHLNDCKITVHPFQRGQNIAKAYREACIEALQSHYDLALVVIEERFHELYGDANPYLVSKAVFMNNGVPVQEVEIETIRTSPYQIQFILNNIALACYSKLGGIPYAITASPVVAQELVIGLGSAVIRRQRLQGSDRVVGITTIFNADGTYLLSNTSKEADYDSYIDELLDSLRSSIEDVKKRNAWQDGDQVRLVFHVFKPLKDLEAIAIKRFVEEIAGKYQVEFAFLTFTRDHPFTILDQNQVGVDDRGRKKGALVPERGYAINTSGSQALLTLTGPRQLKTAVQGCPKPMILKLHKESTFRDIGYLTHQAYKFTFLSWRSFFPTMSPVTIAYSQLIAKMLGELKGVSNWNPEILRTRLRTSRWFL